MRPSAWVSVLAASLLTAAFVHGMGAPQPPAAVPAKVAPPAPKSWVVTGQWMTTDDDAVDDALSHARDKVQEFLRAQQPPLTFPLDPTFLRQRLWRPLEVDDAGFKALVAKGDGWQKTEGVTPRGGRLAQVETKAFEGLGEMHRAAVRVEVDPRVQGEFEQQEAQWQAKQRDTRAAGRQSVLVRVLAAVVAVLIAVALYFRLEDATKGYYTTLLRLAAMTVIALAVAGALVLG